MSRTAEWVARKADLAELLGDTAAHGHALDQTSRSWARIALFDLRGAGALLEQDRVGEAMPVIKRASRVLAQISRQWQSMGALFSDSSDASESSWASAEDAETLMQTLLETLGTDLRPGISQAAAATTDTSDQALALAAEIHQCECWIADWRSAREQAVRRRPRA